MKTNSQPTSSEHTIGYVTCPSQEVADRLASLLVESHSAACVNIIPGITSVYRWQGRIERDSEILLMLKTTLDRREDILSLVNREHPYDEPEVIFVGIDSGRPSYLDWVSQSVARV